MFAKAGRYIVLLFFLFLLPPSVFSSEKQTASELVVFHSPNCHECVKIKNEVMPGLEKEFRGRVVFTYLDVDEVENYKLLLDLMRKGGNGDKFEIPVFYMNGESVSGAGSNGAKLHDFIIRSLAKGTARAGLVPVDPVEYFRGFVPLSVTIAGLEDGINPCAFTVIVFFMSFLALQGYRRRELFLIGLSFIAAVFLTYLGIGLGVFNFLYRFRSFWAVTRLLNMAVGSMSIVFGCLALRDFIVFRKTGSVEGLALQLPRKIKNRIHEVIGFFYRRSGEERKGELPVSGWKLVLSAWVTGFLVSLLEALCTGQVYLPTITFVLKSSPFKLRALAYLLLYNIMFIIPLAVIFVFALMGTTGAQFSKFLRRHMGLIKVLMAVLFFALGIFLIWRG
ncbi:MAG: hypothetical protein PHO34_06350 [Candidatus Omnitrophica bacterium]|nr:hypothetical protein [Candidatus Omnitrophota bacterium]MDD5042587.1 hypothetical protein [Candidatus Omnitrophota bacterium]MDD5501089.1 hypothetical protein [Candidatus Omnitrophota bacterium]